MVAVQLNGYSDYLLELNIPVSAHLDLNEPGILPERHPYWQYCLTRHKCLKNLVP